MGSHEGGCLDQDRGSTKALAWFAVQQTVLAAIDGLRYLLSRAGILPRQDASFKALGHLTSKEVARGNSNPLKVWRGCQAKEESRRPRP
jgi:hypothetical protein